MKKILVITATLGTRETLKRTIDSVREIGGDDVQHIIIAPAKNIPLIKEKYNNIECYPEDDSKKGIYAALNTGFNTFAHDYEYMTFINDDDYWLPDFRVLIDSIMRNPNLDLVYAKTKYVSEDNLIIGNQACYPNFKSLIPLLQAGITMLTQQATIIKSNLYFEIGGFDESYKLVADTKFWAQLSLKRIRFKYFDKYCAAYMIQSGQLSSDHKTQDKERKRLLSEVPLVSPFTYRLAKIKFRIYNINTYLKRLTYGGVKNPFLSIQK